MEIFFIHSGYGSGKNLKYLANLTAIWHHSIAGMVPAKNKLYITSWAPILSATGCTTKSLSAYFLPSSSSLSHCVSPSASPVSLSLPLSLCLKGKLRVHVKYPDIMVAGEIKPLTFVSYKNSLGQWTAISIHHTSLHKFTELTASPRS
jgi:hypothetical protein